jgi:hypothetical protein
MGLLPMRMLPSDSTAASRLRPRAWAASVAGLCLVLTTMMDCQNAAAATGAFKSESDPIRMRSDNPHYFAYKGKPIVDVETAYYPSWYGHPVEETRAEGWYGMLGGLAGIIHLNAEFSVSNPSARGTSTEKEILPQKRVLMDFLRSLDFVRMTKFTGFRVTDSRTLARGIAQPGEQYALYLFHGTRKWDNWSQGPTASRFTVDVNWFADTVSIDLPRGPYSMQWINPATGL